MAWTVISLVISLINERKREKKWVLQGMWTYYIKWHFTLNENLVPGNKKQSAQYTKTILISILLLTINNANSKINACLAKIYCNQIHRMFKQENASLLTEGKTNHTKLKPILIWNLLTLWNSELYGKYP